MKVKPAIVIAPVRVTPLMFGVTEYETVPLPDPLEPPVMASIDVELDETLAVHAHPGVVVTVTLPSPPMSGAFAPVLGEIAYVHVGGGVGVVPEG
jgi:hypothetical protein